MVENLKQVNKAFEKEVGKDSDTFKTFSGIFDLIYKEGGRVAATFSRVDVAERMGVLFTGSGCRMWYSLHDKDTFNGELKIAHVHFVLDYHKKRHYSTVFREICEAFGLPMKVQGITKDGEFAVDDEGKPKMILNPWLTLSACISMIGAIRYLVHASNPEKYQYPFHDIITNDIAMAKLAMLCKNGALTSDVITDLVWRSRGNVRVICNLMGLDYFQKYNSTIRMLVSQYRYEEDAMRCTEKEKEVSEPYKFA